MLMFCLAQCDEIESDADNEVMENIFAARDEIPEKRKLSDPKKDSDDQCGFGFWCSQKTGV